MAVTTTQLTRSNSLSKEIQMCHLYPDLQTPSLLQRTLLRKVNVIIFSKNFPFLSSPPTFFIFFFLNGEIKVHEGSTHLLQTGA